MIDTTEIKRTVTPAQAIEYYTGMRKTHNKYKCPFHADNRPSLSVKADTWKCWACNEGGDVINFVQKYFGLSFVEACKKLSDDFNIGIEIKKRIDPAGVILAKIEKDRQQQLRELQEDIDSEIEKLTAVHRALFHTGHEAAAAEYAELLDNLRDSDLFTSYELLFKNRYHL